MKTLSFSLGNILVGRMGVDVVLDLLVSRVEIVVHGSLSLERLDLVRFPVVATGQLLTNMGHFVCGDARCLHVALHAIGVNVGLIRRENCSPWVSLCVRSGRRTSSALPLRTSQAVRQPVRLKDMSNLKR